MRTLQEWLGHCDFATTLIYADCQCVLPCVSE
jgi:site-specific recombinase XerC